MYHKTQAHILSCFNTCTICSPILSLSGDTSAITIVSILKNSFIHSLLESAIMTQRLLNM